jgi:ParB family chromosome partitioning protein
MSNELIKNILAKKQKTGSANPIMDKMIKGEDKEIATIPLAFLKENPYQPRIEIKPEEIKDLANSIKEKGLLQPILVAKSDEKNYYIVAGHRRVEAHKWLGKKIIKARVIEADNENLASLSLIENLQREDLDLIETAIALKRYKNEFNKTDEEIGKEIGKSRSKITQLLNVLNLSNEIIQDVKQNKSTKDILALNILNSYYNKVKKANVNMLTISSNNHNIEAKEQLKKIKNEILELYKGFLANGREWLKKEIDSKLKNVSKNKKKDITVNFGKRKTKIELNIELNNEEIEAIKKFLEELSNKKEANIDIKENSYLKKQNSTKLQSRTD